MKKERLAHGWGLREFAQLTGSTPVTSRGSRTASGRRPRSRARLRCCFSGAPWAGSRSTTRSSAAGRRSPPPSGTGRSRKRRRPGSATGGRSVSSRAAADRGLRACPDRRRAGHHRRGCRRPPGQPHGTSAPVLGRDDPPGACSSSTSWRCTGCVGSAEVMAAQLHRLRDAAALPLVTLQVLPAVAHPANASGFDHRRRRHRVRRALAGGYVFTDEQTVSSLAIRFDSLRGECMQGVRISGTS